MRAPTTPCSICSTPTTDLAGGLCPFHRVWLFEIRPALARLWERMKAALAPVVAAVQAYIDVLAPAVKAAAELAEAVEARNVPRGTWRGYPGQFPTMSPRNRRWSK